MTVYNYTLINGVVVSTSSDERPTIGEESLIVSDFFRDEIEAKTPRVKCINYY